MNIEQQITILHDEACKQSKNEYRDPKTGFIVFTKIFHLKRGLCCGSACRHCPFNHENVKDLSRKS